MLIAAILTAIVITTNPLGAQRRPPAIVHRDSSPRCLDCSSKRKPGRAIGETIGFELLPYTFNRYVAKTAWSRTSPQSWSLNLRRGWGWDTDHFAVNQFAHPYSGNLYYNSARSQGFGFWTAAPFALGGSVLWEYFGETTRPSTNDLINTTLGGITLGETTYRLSTLILDERKKGLGRVVREVGAALVDPPRGVARLLSGDFRRVGANPPDRRPSVVASELQVGYQRVSRNGAQLPLRGPDQPFASYILDYGDPLRGDVTHPFGAFRVEGTLGAAASGSLSQLRTVGFLAAHDFRANDRANQRIAVAMNYQYLNNRAFQAGDQGLSAVLMSRFPFRGRNSLRTEAWLIGTVLGAVRSDYSPSPDAIANETARNYDYGSGGSARGMVRFDHGDRATIQASYQATWLGVISGAATLHQYQTFDLRARLSVTPRLSLGANELQYHRVGEYTTHPDAHVRDWQSQAYLAIRL